MGRNVVIRNCPRGHNFRTMWKPPDRNLVFMRYFLSRLERCLVAAEDAFRIKATYKGSVVWEGVICGKKKCCCASGKKHGPYGYLHYYCRGNVVKKYLGKTLGKYVAMPLDMLKKEHNELLWKISLTKKTIFEKEKRNRLQNNLKDMKDHS